MHRKQKAIIGISAHFHDSACCLLLEGQLVAAAQEERFSRIKHDPSIPRNAFRYCLDQGQIHISDIDCVAYYENPVSKLARQLSSLLPALPESRLALRRLDPKRAEKDIRANLGYEGPLFYSDHHEAHAASAFYFSGFPEAALMTADGVGEWTTSYYGHGQRSRIEKLEEVDFPNSFGLLYSAFTNYLGFSVNDGEYKVMGLAPYGRPTFLKQVRSSVESQSNGQYTLNMSLFDFRSTGRMYSDRMIEAFGQPPRQQGEEITQFHKDVAHSLQVVLEEVLIEKTRYLRDRTGSSNLCMAGGVALNCVANSKILKESGFKNLFVQPGANDAGCALGTAALAYYALGGTALFSKMEHDYLGPQFGRQAISTLLHSTGLTLRDFAGDEQSLVRNTATLLAQGKVLGWFCGRMEFGPRSLGARSILADPRDPNMRERINALVKKREAFRPFAPAVLDSKADRFFDLDHPMPFMLETCQVKSTIPLPAVTHVDGSARVQTVSETTNARFARLLSEFEAITGCPILLNTSFNMSDEPIVCTPTDAVVCFLRSEIDYLVIEDFIVERPADPDIRVQLLRMFERPNNNAVSHDVYAMF